MTLDLTKSVQTRDGRPVRILCTDAKGICSVVGLIHGIFPKAWLSDGRDHRGTNPERDLINAPPATVTVPEEPTEEMLEAVRFEIGTDSAWARRIYAAMIAARPK